MENEVKLRTVYCLSKKVPDGNYDVYVGSTSVSLEERQRRHIRRAKDQQYENTKLYKRMRDVGSDKWKIVPLFTTECTAEEIRKKERTWCEFLEADLNTFVPILKDGESREKAAAYYAVNRKQRAAHYTANRDRILEQQAAYRATNRDAILEKAAAYRATNRDAYYAANRDAFRERNAVYRKSKKFLCELCNVSFCSKRDLKRHKDTLKHSYAYLESLD